LSSSGDWLRELKLLLRPVGGEYVGEPSWGGCWDGGESLKRWIVSVDDETQRRVDVVLKDMLKILDGIEPRRN
jgi:hypothetical protein